MFRKQRKKTTPKKNKYKAVKTIVDGREFDSKKEAKYYEQYLKPLLASGQITGLEFQPRYDIIIDAAPVRYTSPSSAKKRPSNRAVYYKADFRYHDGDQIVVVDVKGMDTDMSRLKRALVEHIYRIKIVIV